jgi:hypothetical protein
VRSPTSEASVAEQQSDVNQFTESNIEEEDDDDDDAEEEQE